MLVTVSIFAVLASVVALIAVLVCACVLLLLDLATGQTVCLLAMTQTLHFALFWSTPLAQYRVCADGSGLFYSLQLLTPEYA